MNTTMRTIPQRTRTLPNLALAFILTASTASGSPLTTAVQAVPAADIPTIEAIDAMSGAELRVALSALAAIRKQPGLSDEAKAETARAFEHAVARLKSDAAFVAPPPAEATDAESTRYKRLVGLRASIFAVSAELMSSGLTAERRAELRRDLETLNGMMGEFADECAPVTERVPVDGALLRVAAEARSLFGPLRTSHQGQPNDAAEFYVDSVESDLLSRHSSVDFDLERPLKMIRVSGKRWEVEEARRALRDSLPAYIARMEELIATELRVQSDREKDQYTSIERSTVNIDWRGGTLQDLVVSVKALVECNVVLADPAVGEVAIPALTVKRVAPDVFFRSLQSLPLADGTQLLVTVVAPEVPDGDKPGQGVSNQGKSTIATSPMIVIARKPVSISESPSASVTQRIFDLSDWVGADANSIKNLIEAIDFAMQADGSADRVKVRYHEPSRILFAKGPSGSILLIDEIVTAFRNKK
jgi:hypothetical protein